LEDEVSFDLEEEDEDYSLAALLKRQALKQQEEAAASTRQELRPQEVGRLCHTEGAILTGSFEVVPRLTSLKRYAKLYE
jgi:hypothetical protein